MIFRYTAQGPEGVAKSAGARHLILNKRLTAQPDPRQARGSAGSAAAKAVLNDCGAWHIRR
ncbi:MAG: hypothetical protein HXX15_15045 [Rhodopseudomonas sp.]|uniref:hypothetical protein n=1 Tax=Rhodopseudomonas sp. TaxID=1078 RepID=UPI0017B49731|nr:hypothetical protein [Rhodopseudomonas sp.]NVN87393.1 hypothetical protein [Rhodopseudomonas sp.]